MTRSLVRSRRPLPSRRFRASLCVVACIVAGTLQAKDLPRRKADEPKTAEAACAYLGEGYVRAPGTDTCIKLSGRVRAEGAVIWGR